MLLELKKQNKLVYGMRKNNKNGQTLGLPRPESGAAGTP